MGLLCLAQISSPRSNSSSSSSRPYKMLQSATASQLTAKRPLSRYNSTVLLPTDRNQDLCPRVAGSSCSTAAARMRRTRRRRCPFDKQPRLLKGRDSLAPTGWPENVFAACLPERGLIVHLVTRSFFENNNTGQAAGGNHLPHAGSVYSVPSAQQPRHANRVPRVGPPIWVLDVRQAHESPAFKNTREKLAV
ncbi:hypothetical protein CLAIMM_02802, partial [Cladophialophora immunda]